LIATTFKHINFFQIKIWSSTLIWNNLCSNQKPQLAIQRLHYLKISLSRQSSLVIRNLSKKENSIFSLCKSWTFLHSHWSNFSENCFSNHTLRWMLYNICFWEQDYNHCSMLCSYGLNSSIYCGQIFLEAKHYHCIFVQCRE
jgi:hypothetical protein